MYISIDVGGTNIRVAGASDLSKPIFSKAPLRRKSTHDFEDDMDFIVQAAHDIAGKEPIEAVGISAPGWPNEEKTAVEWSKNLASWIGKPLVDSLSEGLGDCPVFYDDDVTVAALGEAYYGRASDSFDYIIWGTGIGGSSIRRGPEGEASASRIDWQTHFAAWENDNGGAELAKKFTKPPEDFTPEDWQVVARDFKRNLAAYIQTHHPKIIVFGGGLAVRYTLMIQETGRDLGIITDVTKFGDNGGLMGGFALIRHRMRIVS